MPMPPAAHGTETRHKRYGCRCEPCVAAHAEWLERNREATVRRVAAWRKANPGKHRTNSAAYRERNRDRLRSQKLAQYHALMATDPERVRANRRNWAKSPKGRVDARASAHRRRGARLTPDAKAFVPVLLADPCAYCGGPGGEIDHIDPVIAGGTGDVLNLTSACRSCNASKNDRPLLTFLVGATSP